MPSSTARAGPTVCTSTAPVVRNTSGAIADDASRNAVRETRFGTTTKSVAIGGLTPAAGTRITFSEGKHFANVSVTEFFPDSIYNTLLNIELTHKSFRKYITLVRHPATLLYTSCYNKFY